MDNVNAHVTLIVTFQAAGDWLEMVDGSPDVTEVDGMPNIRRIKYPDRRQRRLGGVRRPWGEVQIDVPYRPGPAGKVCDRRYDNNWCTKTALHALKVARGGEPVSAFVVDVSQAAF